MYMTITVLLLAAVLAFAPHAGAATYYVNTQHQAASDANPGTQAAPWKTIQKAASTVKAGDTAIVQPGTYPERVNLPAAFAGGTAQAPITFRAEPRRQATFYGMTAHSYAKPKFVRVEGFNIVEGPAGGGIAISYDATEGFQVVDNAFTGLKRIAISLGAVGGHYVARNELTQSQAGIPISGNGYIVEDNRSTRMMQWDITLDSDFIRFFGTNGIVRRNWLGDTLLADIGDAHLDCFQTFTIGGPTTDMLIEGNYCEG